MLSLSDLNLYWCSYLDAKHIAATIGAIEKTQIGRSNPRYLNQDCVVVVKAAYASKMLEDYEKGKFTDEQLGYICDCLTLSEYVTFDHESTHEIIEEMTDPEINGLLTQERIKDLFDRLKNL